jgi:hypothetical protein
MHPKKNTDASYPLFVIVPERRAGSFLDLNSFPTAVMFEAINAFAGDPVHAIFGVDIERDLRVLGRANERGHGITTGKCADGWGIGDVPNGQQCVSKDVNSALPQILMLYN